VHANLINPVKIRTILLTKKVCILGKNHRVLTPEIFALGIVSINGRNASTISFSPDLDEMYFSAHEKDEEEASSIYFSKLKGNKWTPVKRANFTNGGKMRNYIHPLVLITKGFISQLRIPCVTRHFKNNENNEIISYRDYR